MSYSIRYADSVLEDDIPALPKSARDLIRNAIVKRLTTDPIRYGNPLRYSLTGSRRIRVSDYKVIYVVNKEASEVYITAIGLRRDIYED